jgi:hypothetical protein
MCRRPFVYRTHCADVRASALHGYARDPEVPMSGCLLIGVMASKAVWHHDRVEPDKRER